jgi:5'-nucleotidase
MTPKPLILVTNDDGISAPGIRNLIAVMKEFGEVVVVAPDSPQSAMGHAITISNTLFINKVSIDTKIEKEYSCSGTPADCVKIAVNEIMDRKPDLVVSGINHGSNASVNVIYSGTMSAAMEAAMGGIPAIGFSLLDFDWNADFEQAKPFIRKIVTQVLEKGVPADTVLNVNIPKLKTEEIKGIKVCRMAKGKWVEEFDKRQTPHGRNYYWMTGEFVNNDKGEDTDIWALENGYISLVPILFDFTNHQALTKLNDYTF